MVINVSYKKLIHATILSGIVMAHSQAAVSSQKSTTQAPQATLEEARIKHWSMPEIDRNFWDIAELETAYFSAAPKDRKDGIAVGKLTPDRANRELLLQLAREIADNQHAEVDSMLIAHQGEVVFESYYSRGRVDLSHPQSSTTKSYTALAIGRAIQLGYLSMADLHKPVINLLSGLDASTFAKGVESITLHQLMTMSSGLKISPEKVEEYRKNPDKYSGNRLIQAYFEDSEPVTRDAKVFNYQGANPDIVMHVLDAAVPGSAQAFIKNELLHKMGIVNFDWKTDQNGLPSAGSLSSMTSRNMIRIGLLVMNKGKWQGKQFVPQAFILQALNKQVPLSAEQVASFYSGEALSNSGYGYFWWQTDMQVGARQYLSHSAQGGGGVAIVLIEELDLVVAITAHARQAYLQMIAQKVLPAFIH